MRKIKELLSILLVFVFFVPFFGALWAYLSKITLNYGYEENIVSRSVYERHIKILDKALNYNLNFSLSIAIIILLFFLLLSYFSS